MSKQLSESERLVNETVDSVFAFMQEYREKGFEGCIHALRTACLETTPDKKEQLLRLSEINTWDITAPKEKRVQQIESSCLFAITFMGKETYSDAQIAQFMLQFDFEKIEETINLKLKEKGFDFELYKEYLLNLKQFRFEMRSNTDIKNDLFLKC